MVIGIAIGALFPEQSQHLKVISNIFLKLIKCIIVPIIFGTLVVGIAGHSDDLKAVGRLAFKSIIYFEIVTTLALAVGLIAVNIVRPGVGVSLAPQLTMYLRIEKLPDNVRSRTFADACMGFRSDR